MREYKALMFEKRVRDWNPCHWGGMALFIFPYDKYFNINAHHNKSNKRIIAGFIVMMNPYFSSSALTSGISTPVSITTSPTAALSRGWCTELSRGYGLNLGFRSDGLT